MSSSGEMLDNVLLTSRPAVLPDIPARRAMQCEGEERTDGPAFWKYPEPS